MRLIDADALKEDINSQFLTVGVKRHICRIIDNAPAVEITEEQAIDKLHETGWMFEHDREMTRIPQGEWIPIYPLTDKCSLCNGEALDFNDYPYRSKFCPHCGAKMKGGEAVAEDDLHNTGP